MTEPNSAVKQGAQIADGPFWHKIIAAQQSDRPHHERAVEHRPAVGGQRFQPAALVANTEHIAERKTVGTGALSPIPTAARRSVRWPAGRPRTG